MRHVAQIPAGRPVPEAGRQGTVGENPRAIRQLPQAGLRATESTRESELRANGSTQMPGIGASRAYIFLAMRKTALRRHLNAEEENHGKGRAEIHQGCVRCAHALHLVRNLSRRAIPPEILLRVPQKREDDAHRLKGAILAIWYLLFRPAAQPRY